MSAVFITFSGNCSKALTFYKTCFGGTLRFETFGKKLHGYNDIPVVSGSLLSDDIIIHGSDLVHNEGRILGNYMSIFLQCKNSDQRSAIIKKLTGYGKDATVNKCHDQKLIEITDIYEVKWVLGVA